MNYSIEGVVIISPPIIIEGTITSKVVEELRKDIINQRIEPGSRVTIKEIADRYGVSTMPVREAFHTLNGEKMIRIDPYKGATILPVDINFVKDIYELERALECLLIESLAENGTEELFKKLRQLNERIGRLENTKQRGVRYTVLNSDFHRLLYSKSTNQKVLELREYYHGIISTLRQRYVAGTKRLETVVKEHEEIIAAAEAKDMESAVRWSARHAVGAKEDFLQNVDI